MAVVAHYIRRKVPYYRLGLYCGCDLPPSHSATFSPRPKKLDGRSKNLYIVVETQ